MPAPGTYGLIRIPLTFRINVASGTSAEEYVTDITYGFRFEVAKAWFVASGDGAGAGATRLFRIVKGASTVAASATIALAATQTKGTVSAFTLSSTPSDYHFFDSDTFTVDVTGAGTQFTTLTGNLHVILLTRPQAR